ncbi:MAG TPA: hypothetical protein VE777_07695 [Gaiellales bacterium]|jgi:hypothetical protein|nr:hypothetical protein [Gaiellales bacterium]
MPIEYPRPPDGTEAIASEGIQRAGAAADRGRREAAAAEPERVLTRPHPVHNLGLDDLVKGARLADAPRTAWRYLVEDGGEPVASAEVAVDGAGRPRAFDHLNEGPFVAGTAAAQAVAERLPALRGRRAEARLVRIPALYVIALWLKGRRGSEDVVVPIAPAPPFLEANRPYSEDEFLAALREPSRERARFDNSPRAR